jgi:hypothetical protein
MSAASGTLEAAMGALVDTAGFKSQLGLTGVTLSGDATKAKITSSASSALIRSKATRYFIGSLIFPSTPTPYITLVSLTLSSLKSVAPAIVVNTPALSYVFLLSRNH